MYLLKQIGEYVVFYINADIATPPGVLYRQQLCKSQFAKR